jgi:hypothetical protein
VLAGKAPEQIDAFRFDLRRQPLRERGQRDDVVAVILKRRRRDRQPNGAPLDSKSGIRSFSVEGSSSAPES